MMGRRRLARYSLMAAFLAACASPGTAAPPSAAAAWTAASELGKWEGTGPARVHDSGVLELRWPAARACGEYLIASSSADARPSVAYAAGPRYCGALIGVSRRPESRESDLSAVRVEIQVSPELKIPVEVVARVYEAEHLEGVPPKYVQPPKKFLPRIRAEAAEVGRLYAHSTRSPRFWEGPFRNPVAGALGPMEQADCGKLKERMPGCILSRFGKVRTYNGLPRNPHPGTDLRAPLGQPLVAPERGKVVLARNLYFTGNTVILDHGAGVVTLYAHLSKLAVKKGQMLKKGAPLGVAGATGRATGPHLHWGALIDRVKVEPLELMLLPPTPAGTDS